MKGWSERELRLLHLVGWNTRPERKKDNPERMNPADDYEREVDLRSRGVAREFVRGREEKY